MENKMEGLILNFRRAKHHQKTNHIIIAFKNANNRKEAEKLVNKKVVWTNEIGKEKKKINGLIKAAHGNKGAVRAIFEKGLPGQAISTKVKIE